MRTTLLAIAFLTTGAAIPAKPKIEFHRYDERIIGVVLRDGVMEYTELDGSKSYWIPGRVLREIAKGMEGEKK